MYHCVTSCTCITGIMQTASDNALSITGVRCSCHLFETYVAGIDTSIHNAYTKDILCLAVRQCDVYLLVCITRN